MKMLTCKDKKTERKSEADAESGKGRRGCQARERVTWIPSTGKGDAGTKRRKG